MSSAGVSEPFLGSFDPGNILAAGETIKVEELPIRQEGWLDYAYGVWHLIKENSDYVGRYWDDKESALKELAGEGWLRVGPFPRPYRRHWVMDRTYSLIRFLQ